MVYSTALLLDPDDEPFDHPSLDEFMDGQVRNLYIRHKSMESYVRKGRRVINGQIYNRVLTRANTTNFPRRSNFYKAKDVKSTGLYKELDDVMTAAAIARDYDAVYVECVVNRFLPDALVRYGYTPVGDHTRLKGGKDFFKLLK